MASMSEIRSRDAGVDRAGASGSTPDGTAPSAGTPFFIASIDKLLNATVYDKHRTVHQMHRFEEAKVNISRAVAQLRHATTAITAGELDMTALFGRPLPAPARVDAALLTWLDPVHVTMDSSDARSKGSSSARTARRRAEDHPRRPCVSICSAPVTDSNNNR
jgi:hypothetical protein